MVIEQVQSFNLSEKADNYSEMFYPEDVKEFIRLLKEELIKNNKVDGMPKVATFDIIDKLAGNSLTQSEGGKAR